MVTVLGLDLSLTSTGMVAVPVDWRQDWSRVAASVAGRRASNSDPEDKRIERLELIRNAVMTFAHGYGCTHVFLEDYAYTAQHSRAHALGELGGAVKVALRHMGLELQVVSPASARTLLGKQPKRDRKAWAQTQLFGAGAPRDWPGDVADAFIVANWGLSELGGAAVILREQLDVRSTASCQ